MEGSADSTCCTPQEKEFKSREATLKRKDLELQDSLIRFSKFLQDNDMKRVRAHKKAQDERKLCEEQKAEIEQVVRLVLLWLLTQGCVPLLMSNDGDYPDE